MRRASRVSSLLAVGLAVCACSGEGAGEPTSEEAEVVGGTAARDDHAVVALLVDVDGGTMLCTGTFVSPHVIVSAAHCFTNPTTAETVPSSSVRVQTRATVSPNDATLAVAAIRSHPDFTSRAVFLHGALAPVNDVAVLRTANAFEGAPLPFARSSFVPVRGASVRLVGYGAGSQEVSTTIRFGGFGTRRTLGSEITGVHDLVFVDDAGSDRGSCVGDSGGPVLGRVDGHESVIGIISFSPTTICAGPAINARLDAAASFVEAEVVAADPGFLPP